MWEWALLVKECCVGMNIMRRVVLCCEWREKCEDLGY